MDIIWRGNRRQQKKEEVLPLGEVKPQILDERELLFRCNSFPVF